MDIYKLLRVITLYCVINEGFAELEKSASIDETRMATDRESNGGSSSSRRGSGWWGGGRNRSSRRNSSSRRGSGWLGGGRNRSSRPNSSSRRGSGWLGRGRNRSSKPSSSSRRGSGWLGGGRNRSSKPNNSGKRNSRWWGGRNKKVQTKPKPKNRNVQPKPKPKTIPLPKIPQSLNPKPAKKPKQNTKPKTDIKKVIEDFEDVKLKSYDAQPKNPKVHDTTIGIGFNLNRPDAEKTFKKLLPGVDFDKVKSGKHMITEAQARVLFNHDVDKIYKPRARNKVGKVVYDKLPSNVKAAVVNAVFRGDLGPKTTNLIKQGKWKEVGKEYLNHEEYRNAKTLGKSGVKTRMDWNKKQFDTMTKP